MLCYAIYKNTRMFREKRKKRSNYIGSFHNPEVIQFLLHFQGYFHYNPNWLQMLKHTSKRLQILKHTSKRFPIYDRAQKQETSKQKNYKEISLVWTLDIQSMDS